MRKTKKCSASALRKYAHGLLVRKCQLPRGHAGTRHHDEHGAWSDDA